MYRMEPKPSTGLEGLDHVLQGLIQGDNVVWQVDSIDTYRPFVDAYVKRALEEKRKLVYFRFAKHPPLVPPTPGVEIVQTHPERGFEAFITEIHGTIGRADHGAFYVFDCLSELIVDWYSDRMLGNFFMLTCPYLYDLDTIAYFAIIRDLHSSDATGAILNTTQIMLDTFRYKDKLHIHPLKVDQRYSSTLFMLHIWEEDTFRPLTQSVAVSEALTAISWSQLGSANSQMGYWDRMFDEAQTVQVELDRGREPDEVVRALVLRLQQMTLGRGGRILKMAARYLSLSDMLAIRRRMIGTGLIGGKAVGMVLARAILRKTDVRWEMLLEPHDSFFVGTDVFYTYLVQNGLWWTKQKQKEPERFLEDAETARRKILEGAFPEHVVQSFGDMLDYFGQSPIIVRSSSILEDSFGNAFAGKYDSIFCINQGSRAKRLEDFLSAVRTVYVSTMSEEALRYRATRGLLDHDEQMAILVQRVSGAIYGQRFFPQIAGVGLSFNPYVWNDTIDPNSGVVRLVFGLGTRAVDRSDDDYTRVVALNAPERRPEAGASDARQHAQRKVDVLDLESSQLASADFIDVARKSPGLPLEMFASQDRQARQRARERGIQNPFTWFLTFDRFLRQTTFVNHVSGMLRCLEEAYEYPVDVEFTTNFLEDETYKINLVQCRPFQVHGGKSTIDLPKDLQASQLFLDTAGPVIGHSRHQEINRIIYVVPELYGQLPINDRYAIARAIGRIVHNTASEPYPATMLLGPGRWGTSSPDLGVPVTFTEINRVCAICEIVAMREDLVPDVSLGTHFFNELVEMDVLYLVLFPEKEGSLLNSELIEAAPNRFAELLPEEAKWADTIRVIDFDPTHDRQTLYVHANAFKQRVVCYFQMTNFDG